MLPLGRPTDTLGEDGGVEVRLGPGRPRQPAVLAQCEVTRRPALGRAVEEMEDAPLADAAGELAAVAGLTALRRERPGAPGPGACQLRLLEPPQDLPH